MNNLKITLRLLNDSTIFQNQNLLEENSSISINNGNDLLIDLSQQLMTSRSKKSNNNIKGTNISSNSNNNFIKNLDLKYMICKVINNPLIKPENLILFINNDEKYIMLHDKNMFPFFNNITQYETTLVNNSNNPSALNSEMRVTEFQNNKKMQSFRSIMNNQNNNNNQNNSSIIIFYKICNILQKIIVDIYQYKTEKINFNLPISCSIYFLKILICKTLNININEVGRNFNLHGTGFTDMKGNIIKALTNRKFDENTLIYEICKHYKLDNNKIINLLMIEKSRNQCGIGLDFRFNYLKNFQLSEYFEDDTKNFRCVINGLNLYIYCKNSSCKIFNSYFIINKAYGVFDIFPCLSQIKCPFCNCNKIFLRNMGMINAKWQYKGFLKCSKVSKINGDGLTIINNKLYKINDIKFEEQFHSLLFEVEFYQSRLQKNKKFNTFNNESKNDSSKKNLINSISVEENDNLDFNDINLEQKYLTKGNHEQMNVKREFTFQKINSKNNSINNINIINHEKDIIDLFHKPNNIKEYSSLNPIRNDNTDFKIKIDNQKEQCCADCSTMTIDNSCFIW